MLKQYVERQSMTSHRLMSIETVAVVDEADQADEYSLEDCTFPSTPRTETYKDVSISNELTPEQILEVESLEEQYPDVLTSLPGRKDIIRHKIKLLTTETVRCKGYLIHMKPVRLWKQRFKKCLI